MEIEDALTELLKDSNQTPDTRNQAKSLFEHLQLNETAIMTRFWSSIMVRFNKVSKTLQSESLDLGSAVLMMTSLNDFVASQRERFDEFEKEV